MWDNLSSSCKHVIVETPQDPRKIAFTPKRCHEAAALAKYHASSTRIDKERPFPRNRFLAGKMQTQKMRTSAVHLDFAICVSIRVKRQEKKNEKWPRGRFGPQKRYVLRIVLFKLQITAIPLRRRARLAWRTILHGGNSLRFDSAGRSLAGGVEAIVRCKSFQ